MEINAESDTLPVPLHELTAQELNVLDPFRYRYEILTNLFYKLNCPVMTQYRSTLQIRKTLFLINLQRQQMVFSQAV